ncbi:MAG: glycosyltransferase, partial [Bacteroidaceae bacterium]
MMKILHYIPSIDENSGGVGAYMQLLTHDLGALCELHVVTHRSENERSLDSCTVHYVANKWLPWNTCKREFMNVLEEVKPDVVHVNCCWTPLCSLVTLWAKEAGYKVVYTPHGMLEPWIMKRHYWTRKLPAILLYQRRVLRMADMLHATAESEKAHLMALGWNKRICVIGN